MRSTLRSAAPAAALVLLAALSPAAGIGTDPAAPPPDKAAARETGRSVQFTYEAIYANLPADRQVIDVWLPLPANNGTQTISDLVVQVPYEGEISVEPENGNNLYHFRTGFRGGAPMRAAIRFKSVRREMPRVDLTRKPAVPPDPPANLARYLKNDRLVPVDGETKTLAGTVTKGKTTPLEKARAIYDWVVTNFRYDKSGTGWGAGDLKYALGTRKGNCSDFSTAFVGLARASSIPARFVTGFKIPATGKSGTLDTYHCWAEFWLDGTGWVPVDPTEGAARAAERERYFGWIDANRIQYTVGRDITLTPPQNGDPINFFLYPYTEGDGEPLTGNAYRFSWEEAPVEEAAPAADAAKPASPSP